MTGETYLVEIRGGNEHLAVLSTQSHAFARAVKLLIDEDGRYRSEIKIITQSPDTP